MPLILHEQVPPDTVIGLWHCTEKPEVLRPQLLLSPADEILFASIRNENRRRQWLGCRMVLSAFLQTHSVPLRYDGFGKPYLVARAGSISFTHSGSYAAAILSTNPGTGIDLERIREKIARVADRFLTPSELDLAAGTERLKTLTLFWSAKEALYKVEGNPDLDVKGDICIKSFNYLCATSGRITAAINKPGKTGLIPVTFRVIGEYILAWTVIPEKS